MMKNKLIITFILSFIFSACSDKATPENAVRKIPVQTTRAVASPVSLPVYRSGVLSAATESRLAFKIGGLISTISVEEGDQVRKGDLLASLNLEEIDAQVALARSGQQKAQRDLERIEQLYLDSVVTLEQRQDVQTAFDAAGANLRIALFNLKHARILAPDDGFILKRFVEENEMVAPGTPVFYFASTGGHWILRLGATDKDIIRLQLGDSASVRFDVYPDQDFAARVSEIARAVDPQSGTFEVELTLETSAEKLASGFVARAVIFPAKKSTVFMLPVESLVEAHAGRGYVYTVAEADSQIIRKAVTIGPIVDDRVVIESGLSPSDIVITTGAAFLSEKSFIQIIP